MSDKTTRGRASKVDLLPPDIKTRLAMMLRDKMFSQAEILEEINDLIRDCGLPETALLSKTGLNRYASKMEKMGAKIRESREMAEIWTKQIGEAPQSDVGKLLMEAVKTIAFDKAMSLGQLDDVDPKVINQLALVANRIEQAQAINEERDRKIRKEVAQLAAETAEKVITKAGISKETAAQLKLEILGIA